MLRHANDSNFEEQVLRANGPVLVEFFTLSCGPCRQLEPHLLKLAHRFQDQLNVVKINSEEAPLTAKIYGVQMVPTLMIFLDGQIKSIIQGAPPINRLVTFVKPYLMHY